MKTDLFIAKGWVQSCFHLFILIFLVQCFPWPLFLTGGKSRFEMINLKYTFPSFLFSVLAAQSSYILAFVRLLV